MEKRSVQMRHFPGYVHVNVYGDSHVTQVTDVPWVAKANHANQENKMALSVPGMGLLRKVSCSIYA